jgi:hypothetical protein
VAVEYLFAKLAYVTKTVDRVDDEQRRRNVVVYGASGTDAAAIVRSLLRPHPSLYNDIDVAYFLGKARDGAKRPVIIHFGLQSSASAFLRMVRQEEYMQAHPGITASRDKSVTRRVGVSRLSACAERLAAVYPSLTVHEFAEFATFRGQRYDATEFAEAEVVIDGRSFDIDEGCEQNTKYEKNEALFLQIGAMTVSGYKRKFRTAAGADMRPVATGTGAKRLAGTPTLSSLNMVSTGGLVIGGATNHHSSNAPSLLIGANDDVYEVR